jgi:predicted dehydrogenase
MRIAVIGLSYTHPYTYTKILQRMGHEVVHVWDDDPARLAEFSQQFGVPPLASPYDVPEGAVDGLILTARLPERIDHVLHYLQLGIPIYSGKPMAGQEHLIDQVVAAVHVTGTPLFTTSVLRYAPVLQALREHLRQGGMGTLVSVRSVAAHKIQSYMQEPNIWQDDPARGGGTVITMGVHALELLSALVGPPSRVAGAVMAKRYYQESLSEDVALMTLQWDDGLVGTVEVIGGVAVECYGIELFGSERVLRASIPKGDILDHRGAAVGAADSWLEFGYIGTMNAFLEMCRSRTMPIPIEESAAIARILFQARHAAATSST